MLYGDAETWLLQMCARCGNIVWISSALLCIVVLKRQRTAW
ncbi:MAG: hypothetical protein ACI8P9_005093 [Parasphingorhabdus sp.]|jgi:hypothetical protein